jgi:predicted ATPase/class 3 adenylate cyclase
VSEVPSGTVTFLFTDIAGSTRLWQDHPEAMRAALAHHDALLRAAIEDRGGYVVKTTGDGFHAAFGAAPDAIDAAIAGQLALAGQEWDETGPLLVRMGVHTCEAESRGGDYYGSGVNRAARLMGVAHGGQIVVSLASSALVRDALFDLVDLGEHRLRDLALAERLFQVVAPGLSSEFPPLRSLDAFPGNLPVQVTSFVGRDDDVGRAIGLFDEARLVTLAGTGGVGKTRLAVQVAAEVLARFGDGAWFCELAAADDAETMAQVVGSTLGCVQHPGLSLAASIVEYLKVRELLLVLDNCEQLLDDAGDFAEAVVQGCPKVSVLATSREALDVPGERVMRVRSLATPERAAGDAELMDVASVQLFRDRARDAGADLVWDERQWAAVGEICLRVDGIPLAIELAAARTVSMNPIDIAGHLDERFRLLTGKRRGRIERHQTLRATVEWSYQLLGDEERAVFDRLGTFAGSFDEAAAIAVAGGGDELDAWTVTDALASLVAKSMLGTETGPGGETRYTMLETLRQYAREQLDDAGDTDRCRRAQARHIGVVARDVSQGVLGPEDVVWLARVRADLDNIRASIGWALDRDDPADQQLGLSILASLAWVGRNNPDLGLTTFATQAVPLTERSAAELRTPILVLAAFDQWYRGDLDQARHLAELTLDGGIEAVIEHPLDPLGSLVTFEMTAGNESRAFELAAAARTHFERVNSEWNELALIGGLAAFEAMAGQLEAARADSDRALQLARRLGNQHLLASAFNGRAWALRRDDPEGALAAAEEFLEIYRRSGLQRSTLPGLMALAASVRARLGDDEGALTLLRDAITVCRDDGVRPQAAAALGFALNPLCHTGRPDAAAILIGGLDRGALAAAANFPGTADSRARTLARIRDTLGQDKTDQLVDQGASMTYDELIAYAFAALGQPADHAGEVGPRPAGGTLSRAGRAGIGRS